MHNLLEVKSRSELREWLRQNHDRETECWVAVRRGRPVDDGTFRYVDAVEEALCFGWIDSTVKKISDEVTVQKLCPRKPRSNWSELNKERCRRMERLGLMTDAGRAVLPDMSAAGFTIDPDILRELQADPVLWENFRRLPELYRRVRIDTIQIKRNQPELFRKRLDKFLENTRRGILYGEWNDNGRLWPGDPEMEPFVLRPWRESDGPALARCLNNRKIWDNCRDGLPYPYTEEDALRFIRSASEQEGSRNYCIEIRQEAAGNIGFIRGTDVERYNAEVGYWLAEPYWNRGIMSRALKEAVGEYLRQTDACASMPGSMPAIGPPCGFWSGPGSGRAASGARPASRTGGLSIAIVTSCSGDRITLHAEAPGGHSGSAGLRTSKTRREERRALFGDMAASDIFRPFGSGMDSGFIG